MSGNLSRRDFIKTSAVGASVALAAGASRAYAANERVNLGWIGVGGRGSDLLGRMVKSCPNGRIAAVCDLIPEKVEKGKKIAERDKPKGYTDFRKMMDEVKPDGILVFTEPNNHAPLVVPVLEAGFHCFAEKPMDTTVEKIDAITNAARKAKGFYQIGTQRRYHPGYLKAMPMIHSGEYGNVIFMQGNWHWPWDVTNRRVERDGGSFIEQASHHVDVMSWAMKDGAPKTCVSIGYTTAPKPEGPKVWGETQSATAFQFENGVILSYTHLFGLPGPHYTDETLSVMCEKAGFDLGRGMMYPKEGEEKRVGVDSKGDWNLGTDEELCDFVENVKTGGKRKPNANVDTGRICSLMCVMARMAMVDEKKNAYEPRVIHWKDIGSRSESTAQTG